MKKYLEWTVNELYLAWAYIIVYFLNNFTQAFAFRVLREGIAGLYLWTLLIYIYHTFFTKKYLHGKYHIAAQIFLLINVVLSFIHKENFRFSILQDFGSLVFFLFPCVNSFMNRGNSQTRNDLEKLLTFFKCVTFATSFASIIGIYMKNPITHFDGEGYGKVRGFYHNYNDACLFAYVSAMISVYFLNLKYFSDKLRTNWTTNLAPAAEILNIIAQTWLLYIIQSRTAMISYGFGLILLIFYYLDRLPLFYRNRFWIITTLFILAGTAAYIFVFTKYGASRNIYYYLSQRGYHSLSELTDDERLTMVSKLMSGRYKLWKATIEQIKLSPWIGYGLKSAGFTHPALPENLSNVHNILLNVMLYTGVIGTVSLFAVFYIISKEIHNNLLEINIPLKALYFSFFSVAMLEPAILYNWRSVSALFWMVAGFLATELGKEKSGII